MTTGAETVRLDFNPAGDPTVRQIKEQTAELIDMCNSELKVKDPRLAALAATAYEEAAMWAVKAATTGLVFLVLIWPAVAQTVFFPPQPRTVTCTTNCDPWAGGSCRTTCR